MALTDDVVRVEIDGAISRGSRKHKTLHRFPEEG